MTPEEADLYRDALMATQPLYDKIEEYTKLGLGHWIGGFVDNWSWDHSAINSLSGEDAKTLYLRLKAMNKQWR